jgi:hypothetical protein
MLPLSTLIAQLKYKTGYGDAATTSDDKTENIVHWINERRLRLWRRFPWHWAIVEFTVSFAVNEDDYTLDSTVGDIIAIDNGNGDYLKKRTIKQYLQWFKGDTDSSDETTGNPSDYVRMGQVAATKAIKIKVWPTPQTAVDRAGFGKQRITRYSVADIATNTDIEYFPDEVIPVLEAGVLADIYEAQGKTTEMLAKENYFKDETDSMVKEETTEEDDEEQSAAPDYMTFHKRKRGGTTVT